LGNSIILPSNVRRYHRFITQNNGIRHPQSRLIHPAILALEETTISGLAAKHHRIKARNFLRVCTFFTVLAYTLSSALLSITAAFTALTTQFNLEMLDYQVFPRSALFLAPVKAPGFRIAQPPGSITAVAFIF